MKDQELCNLVKRVIDDTYAYHRGEMSGKEASQSVGRLLKLLLGRKPDVTEVIDILNCPF